nr:ubiquilin-1-like [Pogona vitticeps]
MVESRRIPGVDLGAPSEPQVVRILVKSPWQKEEFLLHKDTSVRELKEHVARHFSSSSSSSSSPDQVELVYAGRILKDRRTLSQHGLHLDRDATVHVVIRPPRDARPQQASAAPAGSEQTFPRDGTFARDRLRELTASLGLNTTNFGEFQSQLMSNPEVMLQLLEDPFIQSKLSRPGLMKELVTDNPQVRQVMQRAPEISHFFSSPEGVKLVVELAKNPAAVREIIRCPPQALRCPGRAPSGDNNGALPDSLTGMPGLGEKAVAKRTRTPLWSSSSGGPQAPLDGDEKPGWVRERLPSPRGWSPKPGPQNPAAGGHEPSKEGSQAAFRGEAGQLASAAVKSLLHQIIKHLVQNMAGSPSRNSSGQRPSPAPETGVPVTTWRSLTGPRTSREHAVALPVLALLQQFQSADLLLASWSPKEIQGLLEIQYRLQALAADAPSAERRGRSERPARRAHSITSLCDPVPPAPGGGPQEGSAPQVLQTLQTLISPSFLAGAKSANRPRGSSAQPSAEQKRMYKL